MSELPGPVNLVAEAPDLDVPRLIAAVGAAQVGIVCVIGLVAILDPVAGFVDGAEAGVDADIRLGADPFAVAQELVGAEAVRFQGAPGVIAPHGALLSGAYAILPMVAGDEVATRPAEQGNAEALDGVDHVLAETVGIGQRAPFVIDAAINAATEVFGEVAEQARVHLSDDALGIDLDARFGRRLGERERGSGEHGGQRHGGPHEAAPNPTIHFGRHGLSFLPRGAEPDTAPCALMRIR